MTQDTSSTSLMVDAKGRAKTYAVVDVAAQTIVAGASYFGEADKVAVKLGLRVHNVTHPKCPDWIKAQLLADREYRTARAADYQQRADDARRKAQALIEEADRFQTLADTYMQPILESEK